MEQGKREEKAAEEKKGGAGKIAAIVLCVLLGAAVLTYGTFCVIGSTSECVYPNVQVVGVEVGGLTQAQAETLLGGKLEEIYATAGLPILLDGDQADHASLEELGVEPDAAACAAQAYAYGRSAGVVRSGWKYISCLLSGVALMPETTPQDAAVDAVVERVAESLDIVLPESYYRIDENDEEHIYFTKPYDGRAIDRAALKASIVKHMEEGDLSAVECAYTVIPAETLDVAAIQASLVSEMKNATYDAATDSILPEQKGVSVSVSAVEAALSAAEPGEEVAVAADITYPEVTAEHLKGVLFRDVLGSYTTYVSGTANRRSNVHKAAAAINGKVFNAGEIFDYNQVVGKRTAANGYLPAPAYVQGETVDEIGGGICQVSSTLYYAVLRGNLKIVERWAHRYAPSYIPLGMDATVSWGGPEFKFENDTKYPLKILTSWEGNNLTVTVMGTNETGNYARMTYVTVGTTAWQLVEEEDPTLAPGTEIVKTTPYSGIKVQSYRHVYDKDGNLISSTFEATSDYKARNKVVRVGPKVEETPDPGTGGTTTPGTGGTTTPPSTGGTTTPGTGGTTTPDPGTSGGTVTPDPGTGGGTATPDPGTGGGTVTPDPGTGGGTTTPDPGTSGGETGGATDSGEAAA